MLTSIASPNAFLKLDSVRVSAWGHIVKIHMTQLIIFFCEAQYTKYSPRSCWLGALQERRDCLYPE